MDLQLYLRVVWRFRLLIVAGVLLALALSFLTHVRVSFDGLKADFSYREQLLYESSARAFVTQQGAPWAKTNLDEEESQAQSRLSSLAALYANLAETDEVLGRLGAPALLGGVVDASVVRGGDDNPTPFVEFSAVSTSPETALTLPIRHYEAFAAYLEEQQATNRVPEAQRVRVPLVQSPVGAVVIADRSLTKPVAVFLAVMIAIIGLAFVLENLRPRVRPVAVNEPPLDSTVMAEGRKTSAAR